MLGKIIKSQIKSLLVPGIIVAIVTLTSYIPITLFESTGGYVDNNSQIIGAFPFLSVLAFIFATVLPLCAYSYRYSLPKADFYNQIPFKKNLVRKVRSLILLSYILIAFTVVFFLGLAICAVKNQMPVEAGLYKYHYNLGAMTVSYLFLLVIIIAQYFVSSFFVSKGNTFINSMFLLIGGNVILSLIVLAPICFYSVTFNARNANLGKVDDVLYTIGGSGIHSLVLLLISYVTKLEEANININYSLAEFFATKYAAALITDSMFFIAFGVLGGLEVFFGKEPSGEYYGKAKCHDISQDIIIHLTFGIIGLFVVCSAAIGFVLAFASTFVFYAIAYYMIHSLLNRSFKFTKRVVCIIVPVVSTVFVLLIVATLTTGSGAFGFIA